MKRIHIVAGIIFNSDKTQVFITKRPSDKHKGGYWEFPGGKVEARETYQQALVRELEEEIDIRVENQSLCEHLDFDYVDKSLTFDFIYVHEFSGTPYGKEGQEAQWVNIIELTNYDFPEANRAIVDKVIATYS